MAVARSLTILFLRVFLFKTRRLVHGASSLQRLDVGLDLYY